MASANKSINNIEQISDSHNLVRPEKITGVVAGYSTPVQPGTQQLQIICPITEEPLYELQESDADEVNRAVAAARNAFDTTDWPHLSHNERRAILRNVRNAIEAHAAELAAIQTLEVGIPIGGMLGMHLPRTVENFDFFMEVAGTLSGEAYTQTRQYLSVVTREAAGVCVLLSPWNAPTVLVSMKLAAALVTGNTVVIKASEYSPWSLQRFVEIINAAGLPPGVVNLVNGRGHTTGQTLVEHPGVDVIGFVGGTETGKAIMASAAKSLKKVGMELGGKSANIVKPSKWATLLTHPPRSARWHSPGIEIRYCRMLMSLKLTAVNCWPAANSPAALTKATILNQLRCSQTTTAHEFARKKYSGRL